MQRCEALLLPAGHPVCVLVEAVLYLVPEGRRAQGSLDPLLDIGQAQHPRLPKATLSKIDFGNGFGF